MFKRKNIGLLVLGVFLGYFNAYSSSTPKHPLSGPLWNDIDTSVHSEIFLEFTERRCVLHLKKDPLQTSEATPRRQEKKHATTTVVRYYLVSRDSDQTTRTKCMHSLDEGKLMLYELAPLQTERCLKVEPTEEDYLEISQKGSKKQKFYLEMGISFSSEMSYPSATSPTKINHLERISGEIEIIEGDWKSYLRGKRTVFRLLDDTLGSYALQVNARLAKSFAKIAREINLRFFERGLLLSALAPSVFLTPEKGVLIAEGGSIRLEFEKMYGVFKAFVAEIDGKQHPQESNGSFDDQ
ncbi:MAG: hypothetical protein AB7F43_05920 [Bacteriovoracia bacterium]